MPSLQLPGAPGPSRLATLATALQTVPLPSAAQTFTPLAWHAPMPALHGAPTSKPLSTAPSPSLSRPSQTSAERQLESAGKSVWPSQSLSMPSLQLGLPNGPSTPGDLGTALQVSVAVPSRAAQTLVPVDWQAPTPSVQDSPMCSTSSTMPFPSLSLLSQTSGVWQS